ncbi:hypothetical protein [Butyrivibrio fibrisolvens]|uniref:hypothetical protein n=1 Tax=Butyrivibrio fibrisolvens TaxID=831 RepID=UPI0003B5C449|nr:hypothetical protein [Butyrivibrio fibrisolvens]
MARTAKFTDDLLLDAVVKYSDTHKEKIKATELAEWARKNIPGLEEVKDYHFTRPIKNPKTGALEKKLCTQRIDDLNVARDTRKKENRNVLLSSVNIERFYSMSEREQRNCIVQAREIVAEYRKTNSYLRKKNDYLNGVYSINRDRLQELELLLKEVRTKQKQIDLTLSRLKKNLTEEKTKEKLAEIGITDGKFDLIKYNESLKSKVEDLFNIDEVIREYQKGVEDVDSDGDDDQNILDKLTDF